MGAGDILHEYAPWRMPGAAPPQNPLLDDAATGLLPWMAALRRDRLLLAAPNTACGAMGPLAGVFALLSPTVLVPFATLPRALAITGMALVDATLGFAAFYFWRRRRGDADLPAALGAAVWAWAPLRAVYRTWPYSGLFALFPLLLLAVDLELEPPDRRMRADRRGLLWAALAAGLVLGGHPSFGLMGVYTALAYGAARLPSRRRAITQAPAAVTNRPGFACAALVNRSGFACAAAGLSLLALSPVIVLGSSFLADGEWAALRAPIAKAPPVPWRVLLLLFHPFFHGDPSRGDWRGLGWSGPDNLVELQLYMGLATLLLAPLALGSRRRRECAFWAAAAALVLLAVLAGGPFADAARALPGFRIIFLSRLRVVLLLAAAALVSLGAETLRRSRIGRVRGALPALLLFTTIDLSLADLRFDAFPAAPDAPPSRTPALDTLAALAPGGGRRFVGIGDALVPNVAFDLGLEDVRSHLLFTGGYRRFLARLDPGVYGRRGTFLTFEPGSFTPDPFVLDLLGVSALIATPGAAPPRGDFTPAYRGADADVYARPWRPPARLVSRAGGVAETGRVVTFDARLMRWAIEVEAGAPSTLLIGRQRLAPLDRVTLDGAAATPRTDTRAEGLLAVDVPAGPHTLVVTAALGAPWPFLSALGALGLTALGVSAARRRTLLV